jgi:glutathione synthase/RimK-type ligase-like ATP-grasp enzyme
LIYKSVSSVRSIVARLQSTDLDRLADIAACPTQFQQYIPGTDYRVHVVGDELFASEIVSCVADYRYGSAGQVTMHSFELPQDIADRCVRLAAEFGLAVAGIDLRRSPDGEWYCFEVNPAPAFSYYEDRTGQAIGNAIACLLAAGP